MQPYPLSKHLPDNPAALMRHGSCLFRGRRLHLPLCPVEDNRTYLTLPHGLSVRSRRRLNAMKLTTRFFPVLLLLLWQLPLLAATVRLESLRYATPSRPLQQVAPAVAPPSPGVTASVAARTLTPALSVYPNPSRGLITVSVGQKLPWGDFKLRLSNIIGREVRSVLLRPEAADGGMNLNLSDLPPGMYFYSLVQNDKVVSTKRLVLQN
ncbi:T9SS C-terminal target domain-containing protein [Hymenobacter sediminis]|nr:T9SS C-terminal target domain-containing protein [Hymenobacter sediminis]